MVRKLSKDSSKLTGSTDRSWVRRRAPLFVMSITPHERTPIRPLTNSNAPFAILVLPIDLRSAMSVRLCALQCRRFIPAAVLFLSDTRVSKRYAAEFEKRCPGVACLKLSPAIPSMKSYARCVPRFDDRYLSDLSRPYQSPPVHAGGAFWGLLLTLS